MLRESRWQTRPVFVTSTFRDMHAERDWLREHVIPELEERVRERRRHLEMIDLRWGVETVSEGEEHAKELIVLKVCLDEIERSRPFLIALLGDRYGWVPPAERMQAAVDEAGFETSVEGKSVTALEIEFGVLDSPDQRGRSHFYFRKPLPHDEMPPDVAAQYSDAHSPEPEVRERVHRLEALKERIKGELPDRVHDYAATWDAEEQEVVGLEEFGRQVLEDLWRDLADEIPEVTEEEPTWRDEERWAFEEFVEFAARDFVGREEITRDLLEFARSPAGGAVPWLRSGPQRAVLPETPRASPVSGGKGCFGGRRCWWRGGEGVAVRCGRTAPRAAWTRPKCRITTGTTIGGRLAPGCS